MHKLVFSMIFICWYFLLFNLLPASRAISQFVHSVNKTNMTGSGHNNYHIHNLSYFELTKVWDKGKNEQYDKVLWLTAFGENFTVYMKSYVGLVSPGIIVSVKDEFSEYNRNITQDLFQTFKGNVNNYTNSFAYGKIRDRKFDGYIMFNEKYYFVEPVSNYNDDDSSEMHMVYIPSDFEGSKLRFDTNDETQFSLKHNMKADRKHSTETIKNDWKHKTRKKRSVSSMSCTVHLVADHTFYEHVGRQSVGATVSELVYRLGDADVIFRGTDFDGDGYGDNIGFQISKITIFTNKNSTSYKLSDESLSVNDYLDTFSQYNHNDFCLAVAFSYRDFADGVLGLAWVASSSIYGNAGGICQKQIWYSSDGEFYSLNTAVVTMLNYGERILSYELGLVLAHEFGHNFGSRHDSFEDRICSPNDENGNYLMYPYASTGSKPNHNRFSTCSINSIHPVIINKGWCFVSYTGPKCGNFIVESGEECDCGDDSTCSAIDHCCTPRNTVGIDKPCTFRRSFGYECSSKNSPCCTSECKFVSESVRLICSSKSECRIGAICNGTSAQCPENINKIDGTVCDQGRKLCKLGVCSQSICFKYGLDICRCSGITQNECLVCCKYYNSSNCLPSSNFAIYDDRGQVLRIKPGEQCNSVVGICDNNGKCMSKGDAGAFNYMFSDETANDVKEWFQKYWYYVLAGIGAFIFLIVVFVITIKKKENIQIDAFRLGRLENCVNSAEVVIKRIDEEISQMEDDFDNMIVSIQRDDKATSYVKAVSRLTHFFPTAPTHVITNIVKISSGESVAVRLLLLKGYPMRKLVTSYQQNVE